MNIIVRPAPRAIAAATFTLSIWCTGEEAVRHLLDGDRRRTRTSWQHRVVLVALDQAVDHTVERGREEQRLVRGRRRGAGSTRPAGRNPMSAMRSASSITTMLDVGDRHVALRSSRSIMRPGVATTRSTPRSSSLRLLLDRRAAVDGWRRAVDAPRRAARARRAPARRARGWARGRGAVGRPGSAFARAASTAGRRRASCPSRSWPCRTRRARPGRR